MKLFISGWAGFREALGDIPEDFVDFDEKRALFIDILRVGLLHIIM